MHGGKVIYIDPWKLKDGPKADLILITHTHPDHFSDEDIERLSNSKTVLIGAHDVVPKRPIVHMRPGDSRNLGWVGIEAVPAYNPAKQFHPKTNNWLGFVIELEGHRIYHCGDTDLIPEMSALRSIDVALLPVGGTYTMDPEEAAKAAGILKPRLAIPMHWGDIIGDRENAETFARNCPVPTRILDPIS